VGPHGKAVSDYQNCAQTHSSKAVSNYRKDEIDILDKPLKA